MKKCHAGYFGRNGRLALRISICASVFLAVAALTAGCSSNKDSGKPKTDTESAQNVAVAYQTIDTAYCPLQIAEDCVEKIRHTELAEDGVTREIFYMIQENGEKELFQICFGSVEEGDSIGWFQNGEEKLAVNVIVPAYDLSTFTEAEQETYLTLMDQLNVLLSSIRDSAQFTAGDGTQAAGEPEKQPARLAYWEVMLPVTMEWEEKETNNVYTVDFYGMIDAERIRLYTISLGDTPVESALGMYMVVGEARMLGITPYTLDSQLPDATDAQRQTYSVLMDTINTVLPVIMGSENYSPEIPE